MRRYMVNFHSFVTGATSPVDNVIAPEGYTIDQYLADCENAGFDFSEFINGEFSLEEVEGDSPKYRIKDEYMDRFYGSTEPDVIREYQEHGIPEEDLEFLSREWGNISYMLEEI